MADSFPPPPSQGSSASVPPAPPSGAAMPPPPATGPGTPAPGVPDANGSSDRVNKTPFIVGGAILVVVLIVGVIAALVSDASDDESYSLEAALDNASEVSSVQYDMTPFVGDEPAFVIEGAVDGDVMSFSVDVGALVGGDVAGSTAEVIFDTEAGVVYVQADELIPSTPLDLLIPDLGWIAIDVGELDSGETGPGLEDALSGNPLVVIDAIDADPSDATDLGSEMIDGVETQHYQFTADVAASIEIPDEIAALFDQFDLEIPEGALGEVTYDVWVTEDNQIRRVAVAFDLAGEQISVVLDIRSIGGDVEIEVPSGDEVLDLGELLDLGAILDLGDLLGS